MNLMMGKQELRQNKITQEWVVYSPARSSRPRETTESGNESPPLPAYDHECPFCAGNEDQLPQIITEHDHPSEKHWQIRVVPNKYPAVTPRGNNSRRRDGFYLSMPGYGKHEVIIESSQHNQKMHRMSKDEIKQILQSYQNRFNHHSKNQKIKIILPFRNHGPNAGTSLRHPHSQLMALGVIPRHVRFREDQARRYFDKWGHCIYCDIIDQEKAAPKRIITEKEHYLSFVPYAAETPYQIWMLPKHHRSNIGNISSEELGELAEVVLDSLGRLHAHLDDLDYNFVIHNSSHPSIDLPEHHWFFEIKPRLTSRAGFEIGSGMRVNPSLPEQDAARLRSVEPSF